MQLALQSPPALLPSWQPASLPQIPIPALYVHIPFCFHKCHYCDFYSITRQTPERMTNFVDLLLTELDGWLDSKRGPTLQPQTIFFGGGTPSLLPQDQMHRLLLGLQSRLDLSVLDEWTVECNPATVNLGYCQMLRSAGVNRLSFGAQSFNPADLAILERHHNPADVPRSIELARAAGFNRLNVDLIYAIPNQSLASWSDTLDQALALNTEHISCYALTYESNTPMAVKKRLGHFTPAEDSLELEMLHFTRQRLIAQGYHPYELSNYARPHEECRHNLVYWNGGSYIGLGPSAASHAAGWRWKNRSHLGEWESAVAAGAIPTADAEHLTPAQRAGELAMLQLRLANGIPYATFHHQTGHDPRTLFADQIARLTHLNLLEQTPTSLRLTPTGLNVADAIAAEFL